MCRQIIVLPLACLAIMTWALSTSAADQPRTNLWIDVLQGEPTDESGVLDDLQTTRVVYLGERHTLQRHHELQARLVKGLAQRGVKLVIGMEQGEAWQQPHFDRFSAGQIDFATLANEVQWAKRWHNYEQYRPVLEAARAAGAPILALNARAETIRQVARGGGVAKLSAEVRQQLPETMQLSDPLYEKLLAWQMMVHATADIERLRPMIDAQIARDEAMAATLVAYLKSDAGRDRSAIVICGAGHVAYGLGTPDRVRRGLPGVRDRILLFSESGDVELSPEERKMARPIEITHEQLRELGRPVGDYLYVTSRKAD